MIFVTVGTTMPFDELLAEVDRLAGNGFFGEPVLCQVGRSAYRPAHCDWFENKPNLDDEFAQASGSIVHGGTGSTIEAIVTAKPFVAVANPRAKDDHQAEFLSYLCENRTLFWTRDPCALSEVWHQALQAPTKPPSEAPSLQRLVDSVLRTAR